MFLHSLPQKVLGMKAIPSHLVLSSLLVLKTNENQRHHAPAGHQSHLQGKVTTRKPSQATDRRGGKVQKRCWKQRCEAGMLHFVSLSSNSSQLPATAAQTPGACPKKAEDYDLPS